MRYPARQNKNKSQTSTPTSFPIPILGLNAKDDIGNMDSRYALKMVNAFPEPDKISVRRGSSLHATGMTSDLEALMAWRGPSSVKLLASKSTQTYDVTGTAVSKGTAHTSGQWQHVNLTTSGGHYMVMVNGADDPRSYDGSTLTTTTITGTGLTATNLIGLVSHKSRLWLIEKNTMNAWYLGVEAIAGAAVKFPMGAVFKDGGNLMAAGTYSDDSGSGIDDFLCFISSTGEILMYQGTNPASANTWALVGRYKTGKPLGRRCVENLGGDLLFLTEEGVISMKATLKYDRAQAELASVSQKIDPLIKAAARSYGSNFGWQLKVHPKASWLIVNVPAVEGERQFQYVMNTITGAWCQFDSLNGSCWESTVSEVYFAGNSGKVWKADTGYRDNSGAITADIKTAYNYFNARGINKNVNMVRPILTAGGQPSFIISGNVDFEDETPTGDLSVSAVTETLWETGTWETGFWGGVTRIIKKWTSLNAIGMCVALRMQIRINGAACALNAFDLNGTPGTTL